MLHDYEKTGGSQLDDTTIMPYLRRFLHAAKDRFKPGGSADVLMFFSCLEKLSPLVHQGARTTLATIGPALHILPPGLPSQSLPTPPLATSMGVTDHHTGVLYTLV